MFRGKGKLGAGKKLRMKTVLETRFEESLGEMADEKLSVALEDNLGFLRQKLGVSDDLVVRSFRLSLGDTPASIAFIDGLIDSKMIDEFILAALMRPNPTVADAPSPTAEQVELFVKSQGLPINEMSDTDKLDKTIRGLLSGDSILFLEGSEKAFILNTKGWAKRGVEEPRTESVVRGPRNGFTETLRMNTAQIRVRLKDPNLRVKNMEVGERGNTNVAVVYIEHLTDPHLVDEVVRRIDNISIDAAIDSGYIEQLIEDSHWTPFPLLQNTERPDKVVANLLEGKVAIVCDGSPFVLIAPAVFAQFYHSPEDYYERFLISTLIRIIRIISMAFALLLPSLYIAFSSFHPEMIPSRLVIAMAAGRSTVPFPSIVEALLMEITMEILREASVRLPGPIGPTIGIVGALVVGQAAVEAGIVSPIMVIVVALTTIGSFASPSYSAAIALRMLRFPMMIFAALFGLYGIMLFIILIVMHLCSLKSFGVPYTAPIAPYEGRAIRDTLIRAPLYQFKKRPGFMKTKDRTRTEKSVKGGNP